MLRHVLPLLAVISLQAESGPELLAKVDKLRHPWPSLSVRLELQAGKARQHWLVKARANGDSRVEGLDEKTKGQSVLTLGDDMWLLFPGTKRPVKVSPQQRLLGPASGGDLARTRFAEDYKVTGEAEETVDGQKALRLDLTATRPAISFRTARLWVRPDGKPLRGEFMLPSGKLSKVVRFGPTAQAHGQSVLASMTIEDPKGGAAELRFQDWSPATFDAATFELPASAK